jgi:ectoine hydroxylase-related dioxygenase (phytanoyl-CoA dioxygenase family)
VDPSIGIAEVGSKIDLLDMNTPFNKLNTSQALLTSLEKDFLDSNGYLSLGRLLSDERLDAIKTRVGELVNEEGDQGGSELFNSKHIKHPKEEGADRLANLVNKGEEFDILYTHQKLLAAVYHVLGAEVKISSLNYRAARPGKGLQKLHVDWKEAVRPGEWKVCNSIWLLDDFSIANGATRLVPKSHLCGKIPEEEMEDPETAHSDEIILEAPAGTAVVFNSHIWHGGTTNNTDQARRAIHSYFCARDQPQQTPQQEMIRQETLDRISDEARWLLDV